MIKVLAWHESLGQAHRIMDVVKHYGELDAKLQEAS